MPESEWGLTGVGSGGVDAVVTDVNAADHDFPVAVFDQATDFVFNISRITAAQPGADRGDDAIGAFEKAAVLHFDVGSFASLEVTDAGRDIDNSQPVEIPELLDAPAPIKKQNRLSSDLSLLISLNIFTSRFWLIFFGDLFLLFFILNPLL